jgi:hypothetical protein
MSRGQWPVVSGQLFRTSVVDDVFVYLVGKREGVEFLAEVGE